MNTFSNLPSVEGDGVPFQGDAFGPGCRPTGQAPSGLAGFAASIPIAGER